MEEVEGEPLFCDRVAGIDIGKAEVRVTIRVPGETREGGRQQETRKFGATRRELLALADWLRAWQVERIGMESTLVIRGFQDQRRCYCRSGSRVRAGDGKGKSGIGERPQRDELCCRLSAWRRLPR